jgi:Predicted membrane protein (DUF2178).
MTTEKSYKRFFYSSMMGVIVVGFALGVVFPSLNGWFFLGMALVCGAAILAIAKRMERRSVDALDDERTRLNYGKAAGLTFRVSLPATMLAAILILTIVPPSATDWIAAGRALMLVAVFLSLFMTTTYLVIDRKSR